MPTEQNPKQLIAQRLKDASNILVTVSRDPSVDELSAALAMTLALEKMGKAATAVFSGKIPPAIEFLEPGKTFDANVDGLRDFIIALDKSKADRLRYKVEDDVVRVFITPYKTTITEQDLTYSQGDFNVDLVVAFGVDKRDDLDAAITAHGRILHDASVVTINQLEGVGSLGEIDWSDREASCLCEMLMSLSESLQSGVIDASIASAILTGLVSATDRFRNDKTTPKVMTMAAQLMAAGANQQLIAEKLEEAGSVGTGKLNEPAEALDTVPSGTHDGEMRVEHEEPVSTAAPGPVLTVQRDEPKDAVDAKADQVAAEESADAVEEAQEELAQVADVALPAVQVAGPQISRPKVSSWRDTPAQVPTTGGTLSATSDQAEADKRQAEEDDKNHVLLSHDTPKAAEAEKPIVPALNASTLPNVEPTVQDIFAAPPQSSQITTQPVVTPAVAGPVFEETPQLDMPMPTTTNQTLADLEAEVDKQEAINAKPTVDEARAAVDAALGGQPFDPAGHPLIATGAQSLGEVSHDTTSSMPTSAPVVMPPAPGLPPLPPLPDFSTLPPLPGETAPVVPPSTMPTFGLPEQPSTTPVQAPGNAMFPLAGDDPAQFKLPGA